MWRWVLLVFIAGSAHAADAQQFADDAPMPADAGTEELARVGPVAGVFVGTGSTSTIGPDFGLRGGVRLRLSRYAAVSVFGDLQVIPAVDTVSCPPSGKCDTRDYFVPMATGVVRVEFVNDGKIGQAFVPRFTLGAFGGVGAMWFPEASPIPFEGPYAMKAHPVFRGGLHLGLTKLPDDGWWFPVFLDAGVYGTPGLSPGFYFLAGVGL